ncbi:MAG: LysM peptidoglycan-binding domain-containing protein [Bacteroidales bacterium]|nr:LysM peptidoglycan-binding domain-containing protein [Bacteroidales bacterium]
MKFLKIIIALVLTLCFLQSAGGQELRTRSRLIKENAELRSRVDSLIRELEAYRLEKSVADSLAAEMLLMLEEMEEMDGVDEPVEEYSPEMTDSLLSLWYVHRQMEVNKELTEYDMDSVRFTSDVPDAVLIERLEKMNSFITLPFNETVKNYMVLYSEKMPTKMGHILGLSTYYLPIFEDIFNRYGLPSELKAMAIIESALNPTAVSRAGAKGMWQFMYNTARTYGLRINSYVDERLDVEKAADAAARYLLDSYNIFGDWCLAISAYNCGAGNVNKAIRRAGGNKDFWSIYPYLPKETRGYMPAFVGALYAMTYYKEYGIVPEPVQMPAHTDTFEIRRNLHFSQISEVIGIPNEDLQNLNPQYIHDLIPGNEAPYILKLPYNYTNAFLDNQDSLYTHKTAEIAGTKVLEGPSIPDSGTQERIAYKVKSGDYLGRIASRYGVTVKQLQQWNNLRGTNLRVGQTLYIYRSGGGKTASSSSGSSASASSSSSGYITYTVKSGDTLYKIAQRYPGVTANDIMKINSISSNIKPGMKIKIPTKK